MYSGCVELTLNNGSVIAFGCNVVENKIADNMYQRFELDWLLDNASFEN